MSDVAKGKLHSVLKLEVSQVIKPRVSDFGTKQKPRSVPLYRKAEWDSLRKYLDSLRKYFSESASDFILNYEK